MTPGTHFAWDMGTVTEDGAALIALAVGVFPTQKTCKTQCDKRVPMARIDNLMPTCALCRRAVVTFARASNEALESFPQVDRTTLWHKAMARNRELIERYENEKD